METAREMLKPFRSSNGHFEFNFWFDNENSNIGRLIISYLKSNKQANIHDFEIDSAGILRIKAILIKRAENDGFDGAIIKPVKECIDFLKTSIRDTSVVN